MEAAGGSLGPRRAAAATIVPPESDLCRTIKQITRILRQNTFHYLLLCTYVALSVG